MPQKFEKNVRVFDLGLSARFSQISLRQRARLRLDNGATGNFAGVDQLRMAIPGSVRKLPEPVPVS